MTGTTHQMVALTSALVALSIFPVSLGPIAASLAIIAVMVGALTPDLDQPTAHLWRRMLAGRAFSHIFNHFSGGHRHLTHSLLGIIGINLALGWAVTHLLHPNLEANATIIWYAFMVGYISHPIADTLTDQGVPWFWPLNIQIRIPPGPKAIRITTGSWVERILVRGLLLIALMIIVGKNWEYLRNLFRVP